MVEGGRRAIKTDKCSTNKKGNWKTRYQIVMVLWKSHAISL